MERKVAHQEQCGFLTIAQNSGAIDYLTMAYVQAMSIKATMPGSRYAVIVDEPTSRVITDAHRRIFDYVIVLDSDCSKDDAWKLNNEWKVFWLTPFKETIKLEADVLIPRSIEHWWDAFRLRDVVLSTGCKDIHGGLVTSTRYRQVFRDNDLPDVYSGLMYFRHSKIAARFFGISEVLFANWSDISQNLVLVDGAPTTDVVYALTSKIVGIESTTLPSLEFINFVHMKPHVNKWPEGIEFHKSMNVVVDAPHIRINNLQQYYPVHYHFKDFITEDIITQYERITRVN